MCFCRPRCSDDRHRAACWYVKAELFERGPVCAGIRKADFLELDGQLALDVKGHR